MMIKTTAYLLPKLLLWSLLIVCSIPALFGQNNRLESRIDSNCILHVRLLDSIGSLVNAQAPYLLQVNQQQRNSNNFASWQIDLSNQSDSIHYITTIDANLTRHIDTIISSCQTIVPPSTIRLNNTSATPTFSCNACAGNASVTINNPIPNYGYFFEWSDGFIETDTIGSGRGNLCAGTYTVVVSDSLGNHNSVVLNVLCPAPSTITCFPTITRQLDRNGQAFVGVQDVRIGTNFLIGEEYFIDGQGDFSLSHNFDCADIGYHYLTLLSKDTVNARYDTCQVLVNIIDTTSYCGAYSNTAQVADSTLNPSTCNVCNGYYSFDYLTFPVSGDTLLPQNLSFSWADTMATNPVRFDLCPNTPYVLTVIDNALNRYEYTINLHCPNNNCVTPASIPANSYCPDALIPVCGCDGITYKNACVAEYEFGVQSWTVGACLTASLQLNFLTVGDSSACDSLPLGFGSAFVQVSGGIGPFTYLWSNGQTGASANNLLSGTYAVTVMDQSTFRSGSGIAIVGSQGCVWPGDTDDNGVANNFDLLPIGLAYGDVGTSRNNPSILWQGFSSLLWPPNVSIPLLPNGRHIDCDGSGFIDSSDVLAIQRNYGRSYGRNASNSLLGTIPFYVESGIGEAGDSVTTNIILGDTSNLAIGVYGVAFTIDYDPRFLENDPVRVDFTNSWLGNDLLEVQQDVRSSGQTEVAIIRKDKQPITGQGPIGAVSFTIKDDIMMGRLSGDSIISPIGISNVRLIDERNQVIGTYASTGNIVLEENLSTNRLPSAAGISLFPNPAQEVLHLRSKSALLQRVQLFTATGQLVKSIALNNVQAYSIPTQELANGLYLIQLQTSKGSFSDKIRVTN